MIRKIGYRLWIIIAVLTILLAIVISLARLSLPFMDEYREEIMAVLSEQMDQPLDVTTIVAEWHGLGPRIRLVGLVLLDKKNGAPLLVLNSIAFGIDILESMLTGKLQIDRVILEGVDLSVTRDVDGNVTIQGLGGDRKDASGQGGRLFVAWLLSRDHISITANKIKWQDKMRSGPIRHIHELSVDLRNDGNRHQLDGAALLPEFEAQRITFAVDIQGNILETDAWGGKAYLEAKSIQLRLLPQEMFPPEFRADQGVATVMVWGSWRGGRLQSVTGRAEVENVAIIKVPDGSAAQNGQAASGGAGDGISSRFEFEMAKGSFHWRRQQEGWGLAIQDFEFERGGRRWPVTDIQFAMSSRAEDAPEIAAHISYLDLQDVSEILGFFDFLPADAGRLIASLKPAGRLHDSEIHYYQENEYAVSASFKDLKIDQWKKSPGFSGIDGRLVADENSGLLEISSASVSVGHSGFFRAPLAIDYIDGSIAWEKAPGLWRIRANDFRVENNDIHMRAKAEIEWPVDQSQSPWVDLLVSFEAPTIERASRYLPAGVMKPALVEWLDYSLIAGRIPYGEAMFHGELGSFPFARNDGVFEVRFNIDNGILDYAREWPRIEEIDAEIVFNNKSMEINVADGKSLSSTLKKTKVSIQDLTAKPAMLLVRGNASGPASDALRFISESPLNKKFGPYFSKATVTGWANLALSLNKPLAKAPPEIDGVLTLANSRLLMGQGGLDFNDINGELRFTGEGLFAHDIEATVLDMNADINIQTVQEQGRTVTHIYSVGLITADKLAGLLGGTPLFKSLDGETLWNAAITIPPIEQGGKLDASLVIQSDLKGLAINLPAPLLKKREDPLDLSLTIPLPRSQDAPLTFRLDGLLSGVLDVDEGMRIERGEIVFGEGSARLPDHYGLRLSGKTSYFSFSEWLPHLEDSTDMKSEDELSLVRSVSMAMKQMEVVGQTFNDVEVRALWKPGYWDISAISDELKGDVKYPRKDAVPLIMNLDYLHVKKTKSGDGDDMNPRDMPAIQVSSKLFTLDGINLGTLNLRAEKRASGLHLKNVSLTSDNMKVVANGNWLSTASGRQTSDIKLVFDSDDLGNALTQLGYAENIKEGVSHIVITAQWEGSPMSFSLKNVTGNMVLHIEDGRLLDIEPGAGRVFGLVSLQALPRRFSLDFSDIFDKGFTFDRVNGNFSIANGIATTRDLKIKGPAAKIAITGETDFLARDYDQVVTVIPQVTSGLPVAGVVVGGVGVGAAILLAEQLFKPEIEKATQVQYTVTGSWDDPVITPIQ